MPGTNAAPSYYLAAPGEGFADRSPQRRVEVGSSAGPRQTIVCRSGGCRYEFAPSGASRSLGHLGTHRAGSPGFLEAVDIPGNSRALFTYDPTPHNRMASSAITSGISSGKNRLAFSTRRTPREPGNVWS